MSTIFSYPLAGDVELRLLEPRYAEEIFALIDADRGRLQQWLDWVERTNSVDDTKAYRKLSLEQCAQGKSLVVGIWHRGRFAGIVGLEDINPFVGSAEIGYWLGGEFEGYGLVTNTCRAIIAHAFGVLGLNRLQIRVQPSNARSRAVVQRLGFRHEGTLCKVGRILDKRIDLDVYSLLREEWDGTPETITFSHPLTENTELRLLMPHDAEEIFALTDSNRAHLRRMSWIDGTQSVDDIRSYIRHTLQRMADGTEVHWGIWHHGSFAGIIGTHPIQWQDRRAEYGYWLGEAFQGKGLITAAARAMTEYLFSTRNINRMELHIRTNNPRSRAVAERLGYTLEGIKRQAVCSLGEFVDIACYRLLCEEWEARSCH